MAVVKHEMRQLTLSRSLQGVSISQTSVAVVQSTDLSAVVVERAKVRSFTPGKPERELPSARRPNSVAGAITAAPKVQGPKAPTKEVICSPPKNAKSTTIDVEEMSGELVDLKSSWLLRRYSVLCENIHNSEEEETMAEECTNCCCQAYDSCKRKYASPKITPQLTKSRTLGFQTAVDTVCSDIFTASPIGSIVREFVVYCGFLLMLALWISVLVGFVFHVVLGNSNLEDELIRICQLVLSSLGVLLTFFDLLHHLIRHGCKTCTKKTAGIEWHDNTPDHFHLTDVDHEKSNRCQGCCKYERVDIIRLFVTPLIAYPLLLLSMFQLLSQLVLCRADVTTSLSLVFTIIIQFSLVYLVRMFVLVGMIYSIQKVRTGGESRRALTKGSTFQQYFVANAFGHMFVELLMIATVGVRFYYDYQVFWNDDQRPAIFLPTIPLWYMMVFAYFAAPMGMVLYLLSHYYWTQRFFIKFFVDVLDVLKGKTNKEDAYEDAQNAASEFDDMETISRERKCMYSFMSPTISLLCIAYCTLLLGFGVCALLQSPSMASFGIIGFYAAATVVTLSANFYVCAIAVMWFTITVLILIVVASIIALVLLLIALAIGCFFLAAAGGSSSPPPRQQRHYRY